MAFDMQLHDIVKILKRIIVLSWLNFLPVHRWPIDKNSSLH